MTIEEKRDALFDYCSEHIRCEGCLLRNSGEVWADPCPNVNCPNFKNSPEEDLDKALAIIGYRGQTETNDPVNHPSHYTDGKIEVIDFITDKNLGFCLGNAVKYIARAGKKDPTKTIEDLEKAVWYLNRHIQTLKSE